MFKNDNFSFDPETKMLFDGEKYVKVDTYTLTHQITVEMDNHEIFYDLAKEMLVLCQKSIDIDSINRYSIASVIFSFTTIDSFLSKVINSETFEIHKIIHKFSKDLQKKFAFMSLYERLEMILILHKERSFEGISGQEPYQSLDLLRQLRNFLIHYKPEKELFFTHIMSNEKESVKKPDNKKKLLSETLEASLKTKFKFNEKDKTNLKTFLECCFSIECAEWAFNQIGTFSKWLCEELEINFPDKFKTTT